LSHQANRFKLTHLFTAPYIRKLTNMQKTIALLSFIMVIGFLSGCANTAQGAGRDIENMGEWVQESF
jgi:predicted small secreted protein